ncbi:MAG TPA: hypothetical protein VFN46_08700, partial [Acetobacteraceae bacterium]|nr:hypothetical protein [Acetobacteraceae bacterium]
MPSDVSVATEARSGHPTAASAQPTGRIARRNPAPRQIALIVVACAALLAPCAPVFAQTPAATSSAAAAPWPHTLHHGAATLTVYQPQATSWPERKRLTARMAVAVEAPGHDQPILGTVEVSLATSVDEAAGIVHLSDVQLLDTHFPSLDTEQSAAMEAKLRAALPDLHPQPVPLAAVLLSLGQSPVKPAAVDNTPPTIFYAGRPASLVVFDGDPVLAPAGKSGLRFAVNTNWDVFEDAGTWFLLNNGLWLSAPAATGPYAPVAHLPAAFDALPDDVNFAHVRKQVPARPPKSKEQVPTIFASTKPAEIIVTAGPPHFAPVTGTGLQRVANTPAALFFDPAAGSFYVLFSGRWFSAHGLDGPWAFATDKLSPDFAMIAPDGPDGAVLAAVPGTVAAQEAVLRAQIPTTATLKREAAKPTVVYAGTPVFEPVPGTTIRHAVNTSAVVLEIGGRYYVCQDGAWFVGPSPTGPFALADSIPPDIRTIPPSSPLYNVTYVQVYEATPAAVTYGYTAG